MQKFYSFLDKKHRKAISELTTVDEILKIGGLKSKRIFEDKFDPYVFVQSNEQTPFGGIRIYKLEHTIAYRAQNEEKTHPFGSAYDLPIEKMFEDYIDEDDAGDKVGGLVAKAVVEEIKYFFKKNAEVSNMPYTDKSQVMTPPVSGANGFRANGSWN